MERAISMTVAVGRASEKYSSTSRARWADLIFFGSKDFTTTTSLRFL
jgi:hypothetical protein